MSFMAKSSASVNLLWDNAAFVFGLGDKGHMRLQSMIDTIDNWLGRNMDPGVIAVRRFFAKGLNNRSHFDLALTNSEYGELFKEGNIKISFCVNQTDYNIVFHLHSSKYFLRISNPFSYGVFILLQIVVIYFYINVYIIIKINFPMPY